MDKKVLTLAEKIWDYHRLHHTLASADCLFVLCSHDLRVAQYGAELFLQGLAPLLVFSGGLAHQDDLLATNWGDATEAEMFAQTAKELGVPAAKILVETKATNTGENITFTKKLLAENGIKPQSFILVQKPYMERRTYATFKKLWPEPQIIVTSPPLSFAAYPTDEIPLENIINIMVGDLQRIKIYPERGFQIPQDIPADVWQAYEELVKLGYTKHLIS